MQIDLPEVVAEITALFNRYQKAVAENDIATLNTLFHDDPRTIRFGAGECLYGYDQIRSFRATRSPVGLVSTQSGTIITAYGPDLAVAATMFQRAGQEHKIGRLMQTWVRFPCGWRIVAAHVSIIDSPLVTA
jgi:AtzH-like